MSDRHSTSRASLGDSFMLHENKQETQKKEKNRKKMMHKHAGDKEINMHCRNNMQSDALDLFLAESGDIMD